MANIPGNGRFLYSALTRFTPQDAMAFFEALGVPLKVERGNRVFPVSDRSFDISGALERELRRLRVRMACGSGRRRSPTEDGRCHRRANRAGSTIRRTRWCWLPAACPIPAPAPPATATAMAATLGHTIVPPRGSLVPLESGDADCAADAGPEPAERGGYGAQRKGTSRCSGSSARCCLPTCGVSGPLMLSASAHLRRWDKEQYRLAIDLKPALDEQKLDSRILRDIGENPNRGHGQHSVRTGTPTAWCRCCCAVWRCRKGRRPTV